MAGVMLRKVTSVNLDRVIRALDSGNESDIRALLDDRDTVFWVDWREEDDAIVEYCESILNTGSLAAEVIETDNDEGFEFRIAYNGRHKTVPLTMSPEDRHITLITLNAVLLPEYEIRLCVASAGSDTLAFIPLETKAWNELRDRYGDTLEKHFYALQETPNVFTG